MKNIVVINYSMKKERQHLIIGMMCFFLPIIGALLGIENTALLIIFCVISLSSIIPIVRLIEKLFAKNQQGMIMDKNQIQIERNLINWYNIKKINYKNDEIIMLFKEFNGDKRKCSIKVDEFEVKYEELKEIIDYFYSINKGEWVLDKRFYDN